MMWKKSFFFSILLLTCIYFQGTLAGETPLSFPIHTETLKNGLTVILSEDDTLPLVSVVMAYKVGSIHEDPEKAGLAYLMENIMFQGSRNISSMQHINLIQRVGGAFNAVTTADVTYFFQTVPSNWLTTVLWLESDRMNSLSVTPANVEKCKRELIEEIKQRKTYDPYLESSHYFDRLLYPDFAFGHSSLGNEVTIREIEVSDAREFYQTYYTPNNAVLCIVGYFDRKKALAQIKRYFDPIPPGENNPVSPKSTGFEELSQTEYVFECTHALNPGFQLGYSASAPESNDSYALTIIEYLMVRGKSSRLYSRLVKRDRTVVFLNGGIEKKQDLKTFKIFVLTNSEIMKEKSRRAVLSEFNRLRSYLVEDDELNRAKNLFKRDYYNRLSTTLDKALYLTEYHLQERTFDDIFNELDRYLSVSPARIMRIMNKYFTKPRIYLDIKIK